MKATFFTVTKRENSTYKPSDSGTELTITLKEVTDILSPVIEVQHTGAFAFNMCHIDFFDRWYKIRGVESIAQGAYNLYLDVDVLASWKDELIGQSVYAEMSSYDYNVWLDDARIVAGHEPISTKGDVVTPEVFLTPDPISHVMPFQYVLAAICESADPNNIPAGWIGGIEYMYGEAVQFMGLLDRFADLSFVQGLKSGSPWDAICSAYIVPFDISKCIQVSTGYELRYIWGIENFTRYMRSSVPNHYAVRVYFPKPTNNDFRYSEKFVKFYLNVPYSGIITVPTSLVLASQQHTQNYAYATCTYVADPISGQFAVEVKIENVSLGTFGCNMKIDLALGGRQTQQSFMVRQGGVAALAAIGATVAGGAPLLAAETLTAGAMAGAAGLVKAAIDIPPVNTFGSYGGNACLPQMNYAMGDFFAVMVECDSDIDPATLTLLAGRPSMKITTIQSGYIKTTGASVAFAGLADEIERVNNLLNGGVYVE